MSIEKALAELTEAVKENTELQKKIASALAKGGGSSSTGSSSSTKETTKETSKPAKSTKSSAPTIETIQKRFGDFLNIKDADERKERTDKVIALNKHFGVKKITDADPSDFPTILEMLSKLEAGEDPFDDDEGDAGDSPI